jgi:hypothetical protein
MKNPVMFTGELVWAQNLQTIDEVRGNKRWKTSQILDDKSLKLFKSLNMLVELRDPETSKKDSSGNLVTWTRPQSKEYKTEVVEFNPPIVLVRDDDDEETEFDPDAFGGLIGNGSVAEVYVSVFPLKSGGSAHRLDKVVITSLELYESDMADDPNIARIIKKDTGEEIQPNF